MTGPSHTQSDCVVEAADKVTVVSGTGTEIMGGAVTSTFGIPASTNFCVSDSVVITGAGVLLSGTGGIITLI